MSTLEERLRQKAAERSERGARADRMRDDFYWRAQRIVTALDFLTHYPVRDNLIPQGRSAGFELSLGYRGDCVRAVLDEVGWHVTIHAGEKETREEFATDDEMLQARDRILETVFEAQV